MWNWMPCLAVASSGDRALWCSVRQAPVQMLGFHARNARGIYTPRDSNVHLHLRTTVGSTMGHVTDFTLAPGAIVEIAWK